MKLDITASGERGEERTRKMGETTAGWCVALIAG